MQTTMAWQRISPAYTAKGFQKCSMSIAWDETDDDTLWKDSEEDGNVRCECEGDEDTECEDWRQDTDW
jgi:hypothetical protein